MQNDNYKGTLGGLSGFSAGLGDPAEPVTVDSFEAAPHAEEEVLAAYESDGEALTDLNALDAQTEPMETVSDEDLEARLAFTPSIPPGRMFPFIFKLSEGKNNRPPAYQQVTMKGRPEVQFNYEATLLKEDGEPGRTLRYQKANTYKGGKMTMSRAVEMVFALGKIDEYRQSGKRFSDVYRILSEASEQQATFDGMVKWEHSVDTGEVGHNANTGKEFKIYKVVRSTHPNRAFTKGDGTKVAAEPPWPKDAHGRFERLEGREVIIKVAPRKEVIEEFHKRIKEGKVA